MPRTMLSDEDWERLSRLMRDTGRVYNKPEHRSTLEGILYRMRTGYPWRDLPEAFGHWNTVFRRLKVFRRLNLWSRKGVMARIFKLLSFDTDTEWLYIDSSTVRAHRHSSGARGRTGQAIGRSRGGRSTKIHLAVDSYGLPVHYELSAGQVHDLSHALSLVDGPPPAEHVIADKGYDSGAIREHVEARGGVSVIPRRQNRALGNEVMEWCMYKHRHLVESAFSRIKHLRAIATRYDKLERNFASMLALAFVVVWLPM